MKPLGYMRVENARDVSPEDLAVVKSPNNRGLVERVVYIDGVAYDWNCPQHITLRYTKSEFKELSK